MNMKKIVILGSTGSIGMSTLKIVEKFSGRFDVVGLSAYGNTDLFNKQIKKFKPKFVAIKEDKIKKLKSISSRQTKIFDSKQGLEALAALKDVDIVVIALSGSCALRPLIAAIKSGKRIALANKEALIMAGDIIFKMIKRYKAQIVPIDSEQSAIFQCLEGRKKKDVKQVYLTASGGPLDLVPKHKLKNIGIKEVLRHPRWKMGKKVTVDSSTLMNKGIELIEAMWLFDMQPKDIKVLVHREAIVHSMVEFIDGSIIAQLGITDMKIPIQYALTYPDRWNGLMQDLDFNRLNLTFKIPDLEKFPCLKLAYRAASLKGTAPCVLNAANEVAVEAFLDSRISYLDIYKTIRKVFIKHALVKSPSMNDIINADIWAREEARKAIVN